MGQLEVITCVVGPVQTNCYLIKNKETGEGIVIDPGDEQIKLLEHIKKHQIKVQGIFLTHGHFDHMTAAKPLADILNVEIYCGIDDITLAKDMQQNCSSLFGLPVSLPEAKPLSDGCVLSYLDTQFEVIATPGHTIGSVCYYFKPEALLFSGDTLFFESVGRTDFPTGNMSQIQNSLNERLLVLPKEVTVYPGHGQKTSIGYEINYNPYAIKDYNRGSKL